MKIPNYNFEQFVDNNILNTGFAQALTSIQEFPSIAQLFIPGLINPSGLTFSFNGTLNVTATLNTATPFKVLFGSGALTSAHGTVNGQDTDVYTINFAGLVPGIGSVTAYLVVSYTQILLDPISILGAPPGHPDYSPNFVPYIGYTRNQDTLNVFATTTAPDNLTTMELARLTLVAGQTAINTVDTSHQVLAALNINPGAFGIAGDVTGTLANSIVNRSSVPTFQANNVNAAGALTAASAAIAGTASAANLTVSNNAAITGNITAGGTISAVGQIFGANASTGHAAIMLEQLLGSSFNLIGPNSTAHFTVPVWTGSVLKKIIIQFGSYQPAGPGFVPANSTSTISYPIAFPGLVGCVFCNTMGGNPTSPQGSIQNFPNNNNFTWLQGPIGTIALFWMAIGD